MANEKKQETPEKLEEKKQEAPKVTNKKGLKAKKDMTLFVNKIGRLPFKKGEQCSDEVLEALGNSASDYFA